jgi:hypothetical protein
VILVTLDGTLKVPGVLKVQTPPPDKVGSGFNADVALTDAPCKDLPGIPNAIYF